MGLDEGVQMGPVITHESKTRIEGLIAKGVDEGATAAARWPRSAHTGLRATATSSGPTVLDGVPADSALSEHGNLRPGAQPGARGRR